MQKQNVIDIDKPDVFLFQQNNYFLKEILILYPIDIIWQIQLNIKDFYHI